MRPNKNIALINTIPGTKHNDLLSFSKLKFVNGRKAVVDLLEYYINWDQQVKFDKEVCWKTLFDEPFNAKRWTKYNSYLRSVILRFIAQDELEVNTIRKQGLLMEYFTRNPLQHEFESASKAYIQCVDEMPKNANHYSYKLIYQEASLYHPSTSNQRTSEIDVSDTMQSIDEIFLIKKLQYYCHHKNPSGVPGSEKTQPFEDLVIQLASQESLSGNVYLHIWVKTYFLLSDGNLDHYKEVKQLLNENHCDIDPMQVRLLYTYLENSTKRLFPNRTDRFNELFSLYDIQIKQEVLSKSRSLVQGLFKNIIVVGIELQQFEWVETFIKDHHRFVLPKDSQEDNLAFGLAKLAFAKKEFQSCFDHMSNIEYHDLYIKIESKRLFLKCCFELREYELLDSFLNSFRVFNHRLKNVPEGFITSNNNFIKAVNRLFQYALDPNKSKNGLYDYIQSLDSVYERKWLLEKAEAMQSVAHEPAE